LECDITHFVAIAWCALCIVVGILYIRVYLLFTFFLIVSFLSGLQLYASAVLAVVILSVRLSVRPSVCHTRALWQNQTMHCRYFDITRKGNQFSDIPTVVGGLCPLPSEICTHMIYNLQSCNLDMPRTRHGHRDLTKSWRSVERFQRYARGQTDRQTDKPIAIRRSHTGPTVAQ